MSMFANYTILNLTQHSATPEQIAENVFDIDNAEIRKQVTDLLTFRHLPVAREIELRAEALAEIAYTLVGRDHRDLCEYEQSDYNRCGHCRTCTDTRAAMIGGAPYLMSALERALREKRIVPVYAFSVRTSSEVLQEDGSVRKINVFKHAGFVRVI